MSDRTFHTVLPILALALLAGGFAGCAATDVEPVAGPAAVAPAAAAPRAAETAEAAVAPARRFKILQVNDVYKIEGLEGGSVGGLGRIRTLRKQLEAEGPVLLLHGGDALFPSVMSKELDARPMVECMNLLDGDPDAFDSRLLVTFGNHEFDPRTSDIISARIRESGFRWVTSNIYFRSAPDARPEPFHRQFPNVHHSVMLEIAGLKVAVFSITVDDAERDYLHYDYALGEDQGGVRNAVIRATLAGLEEHDPDVVIALTHQEMGQDIRLAGDFPEIDLVVGGHDHLTQHARIGEVLITKADADAKTAYVIDVDATNPLLKTEASLVKLDVGVEQDPQMQRTVAKWLKALTDKVPDFETPYGSTEHLLGGEEPLLRGGETAMGNWLADVVRETLETDIGMVQGGGVRINDNVPADSAIKGEHLAGIFYFDGDVVSFAVSGQELLEMLRNSVSKVHAGDGRFLQVSGLKFEYGVVPGEGRDPSYVVEPDKVEVRRKGADYTPLDLTASYTVATLKHLWEQGFKYGYPIFSQGAGGSSPELTGGAGGEYRWRAITEAWLKANQRVTVGIEGRIRKVEVGRTTLE